MRALLLLLGLHIKGFFRRFLRNTRTPKGIALTAIGAVLLFVWLGSAVMPMFFTQHHFISAEKIASVRRTVPVGMLALCILTLLGSSGGKGVSFTVAETDILFPGPFSRKQLLIYRMVRTALAALFGAIFMGMGIRQFSVSWGGTYLVTVLMLMFMQVLSTGASLAFQSVSQRLSSKMAQRIILAATLVLAAVGYLSAPDSTAVTRPSDLGPVVESLTRIRDSTIVQSLALPFKPFAYAMTATHWRELAGWTLVSAAVVGVMIFITLMLDADFLEASAVRSVKTYERVSRAKRSGIATSASSARFKLPMPPRLWGAGPIAWRQSVTALRGLWVILVLLALCAVVGPPLLAGKGMEPSGVTGVLAAMAAMVTFMGGALFRFDFRADVDRLDVLKSFPISTAALVLGQLATPVVLLVALQWLLCVMMAFYSPDDRPWILIGALFAPLVSLLFATVENFVFLMYPFRPSVTPGDLVAIARNALLGLAKFVGLAIIGGVAVGAVLLTKWLTGSLYTGLMAGWFTGAALCVALLPAVGWAFHRLDVTADSSPNS